MIRKRLADENDVMRIRFTRSVSSTSATFLAIGVHVLELLLIVSHISKPSAFCNNECQLN
ncbi:hypothetical protein PsorP6_005002 [Peronosclerospora sorghi]|uniref:Uncharacterized protein n=1 Tax=Peronosclerospora sorghi TaxID=230839 RepID=A0ACC0W348_9STRA|nr:hypothetical protein PsorP6_005002 [Peronosclerospora sorghi]